MIHRTLSFTLKQTFTIFVTNKSLRLTSMVAFFFSRIDLIIVKTVNFNFVRFDKEGITKL